VKVLPTYKPISYVEPDFPSVNDTLPGFSKAPELVKAFDSPPGNGATITAVVPTWAAIPEKNNDLFKAVGERLGNTLDLNIVSGNDIWDITQTRLADPNTLPDWFATPTWAVGDPKFGTETAPAIFQDLTPYLSGDAVLEYPHLANIPTGSWRISSWGDKIYAIPMPGKAIDQVLFYRKDLLDEKGITVAPQNSDDLLALFKEINDPASGKYATCDPWTALTSIYKLLPKWGIVDGQMVHRYETEEYYQALEFVAQLYKENLVYPDDSQWARQVFVNGEAYFVPDGLGGWHETLGMALGANEDFVMDATRPFAFDGSNPVYYKGSPAEFYSFIKKTDDEEKIKAILTTANFLASPFGTEEYDLIYNGIEGVHYERGADGAPQATEKGSAEVVPSLMFLASPPQVTNQIQYPGFVEAYSAFSKEAGEYVVEGTFYGMNINEPENLRDIETGITDIETDVRRGRASVDDLKGRIEKWKTDGGNELRDFYSKIAESL
jgi:putative aldouronate transport system substrate-binding protein